MSFLKVIFNKHLPIVLSLVIVVAIGLVLAFGFGEKKAESAWYSSGGTWGYRKQISVDYKKVATTSALTNFPMLFTVTDPDLKHTSFGGKVASTTGGDLLFTSADGSTLLDYEIEKYASTTGELIAWVEVPSLSGVTNTDLFVYFGNASATNTQNPTGVWDSSYRIVQHGNSSGASLADSTSNALNATKLSSTEPNQTTVGKINGSQDYDGSNDYASVSDTTDPTQYTVSAWVKMDTLSQQNIFVRTDSSGPTNAWSHQLRTDFTGGNYYFTAYAYDGGSKTVLGATPVSAGTWYYVTTVAKNDTAGSLRLLVNAVPEGTSATLATLWTGGDRWYIGSNANPHSFFDGLIDELRYSTVVRGDDWISTEYNNQSSPSTFYSYGAVGVETRTNTSVKQAYKGSSSVTWYNSSWLYRSQITVDRSKVATTSALTNFPLLVSVTRPDLKHTSFGGKVASTTGGDLLFTSADGSTLLDYEIEKYASTTGELIAWVEVPSLSGVTNTDLFVYFGNASATNTQNPTGVWDSNYKSVHHVKDGTTLSTIDSTNTNNLTNNSGTATTGKIDGGLNVNGTSGYLYSNATPTTAVNNWTIGAWINPAALSVLNLAVYNGNDSGGYGFGIGDGAGNAGSKLQGLFGSVSWVDSGYTFGSASRWYYVVMLRDNGTTKFYVDGVQTSNTSASTPGAVTSKFAIGMQFNSSDVASRFFSGSIDEVRVSSSVRGADWITTEYNNQLNPGSFMSFGGTQAQESQTSSGMPAPQMKVRGGVKFK